MIDIKKTIELLKVNLNPWPEGKKGLKLRSHRDMVGGLWDEMGNLQFEFLKSQGIKPQHTLLDIGCGCLRAGRFFVEYLEAENYLGVDKQGELLEAGKKELGEELVSTKKPNLVQTDSFEFSSFDKLPDFAIAQSLFTHLREQDIELCLKNLRAMGGKTSFYCTFFETDQPVINLLGSHSSRKFYYTKQQMEDFGKSAGWKMEYIGDWGHPRNQMVVRFF